MGSTLLYIFHYSPYLSGDITTLITVNIPKLVRGILSYQDLSLLAMILYVSIYHDIFEDSEQCIGSNVFPDQNLPFLLHCEQT